MLFSRFFDPRLYDRRRTNNEMFKSWFASLNLSQKIVLGQTLCLGIAACGAGIGITYSNHYYQRADNLEADAREEKDTWHKLHISLLEFEHHQKKLVSTIDQPERWPRERDRVLTHVLESQSAWKTFYDRQRESKEEVDSPEEIEKIERLAQSYPGFDQYLSTVEQQLRAMEGQVGVPLIAAQQKLVKFLRSENRVDFAATSELLEALVEDADEEYAEAQTELSQAEQVRSLILVSSLFLSIFLAGGLSIVMTRATTQPIQAATKIAQQVTEESNFDLQIPVKTQDEVGQLTTVLNRLIQQVRVLLQIQAQNNQELTQKAAESQQQANTLQETLTHLQTAQIQLIQSEKMSTLGELVAGIAHEINNPVGFIAGNIDPAKRYVRDLLELIDLYQKRFPQPGSLITDKIDQIDLEFVSQDLLSLLTSMETGANRIMGISVGLRTFSRSDSDSKELFDVHEGLDSTVMILRHRLKANEIHPEIQVIKHYQDHLKVDCYPGPLNQVLMNLLANAIDALSEFSQQPEFQPKSSTLQIEISTEVQLNQVKIQIKDNGIGMPPAVQQKVFEHLFTTKPVGQGTGLGLSIARQIIVDKHGGQLSCESECGRGTTFTIVLPLNS